MRRCTGTRSAASRCVLVGWVGWGGWVGMKRGWVGVNRGPGVCWHLARWSRSAHQACRQRAQQGRVPATPTPRAPAAWRTRAGHAEPRLPVPHRGHRRLPHARPHALQAGHLPPRRAARQRVAPRRVAGSGVKFTNWHLLPVMLKFFCCRDIRAPLTAKLLPPARMCRQRGNLQPHGEEQGWRAGWAGREACACDFFVLDSAALRPAAMPSPSGSMDLLQPSSACAPVLYWRGAVTHCAPGADPGLIEDRCSCLARVGPACWPYLAALRPSPCRTAAHTGGWCRTTVRGGAECGWHTRPAGASCCCTAPSPPSEGAGPAALHQPGGGAAACVGSWHGSSWKVLYAPPPLVLAAGCRGAGLQHAGRRHAAGRRLPRGFLLALRHEQPCPPWLRRRLVVEEDDRQLTMDFQLDPEGGAGGIMRRFHGRWQIRPHPADPEHACMSTLDQVGAPAGGARWRGRLAGRRVCSDGTAQALLCYPRNPVAGTANSLHTRQVPPPAGTAQACSLLPARVHLWPAAHRPCRRTWRWACTCPRHLTASSSASRATR